MLPQNVDIPVPQVVVVLVEVFTVFSQDRDQQRFAEQIFATLAISPTEVFTHFSQDRVQQRFAELIFQISLAEKIREHARSARHMLTPCGRHVTWKL